MNSILQTMQPKGFQKPTLQGRVKDQEGDWEAVRHGAGLVGVWWRTELDTNPHSNPSWVCTLRPVVTEPLSRPQHSCLRNTAVIADVTGDLGEGWRGHRCASPMGSAVTDSPDPDVAVVEVGRHLGERGGGL